MNTLFSMQKICAEVMLHRLCKLHLGGCTAKWLLAVAHCRVENLSGRMISNVSDLKGLHASILHCNCTLMLLADSPRLLCLQLKLV